jgi:hypothetical protein
MEGLVDIGSMLQRHKAGALMKVNARPRTPSPGALQERARASPGARCVLPEAANRERAETTPCSVRGA